MTIVVRIVAGVLLVAHGLVHLLYVSDDEAAFSLDTSWVVPEASRHSIGIALMWTTVTTFGLLGAAVWGMPGLVDHWTLIAIVGALTSLVLLGAFWNPTLWFGVAIDAAVLATALLRPDWTEGIDG